MLLGGISASVRRLLIHVGNADGVSTGSAAVGHGGRAVTATATTTTETAAEATAAGAVVRSLVNTDSASVKPKIYAVRYGRLLRDSLRRDKQAMEKCKFAKAAYSTLFMAAMAF